LVKNHFRTSDLARVGYIWALTESTSKDLCTTHRMTDSRLQGLLGKLEHELPSVRERALSSLHSKVSVSGLLPPETLPAKDVASALVLNLHTGSARSLLPFSHCASPTSPRLPASRVFALSAPRIGLRSAALSSLALSQALSLATVLARQHPDGAAALCERWGACVHQFSFSP